MEILRAEHVSYSYQTKYQKVDAVKDVSCAFEQGGFYAIIGESGSGKSTFLSLLAGLDVPSEGNIYVQGQSLDRIDHRRLIEPVGVPVHPVKRRWSISPFTCFPC